MAKILLIDDYADLHKVTEGPVGANLFKKLDSKGIVGLAYWDNGFKVMSANKPIRNVADAMGANAVNTMCEALSPKIAELSGGEVVLKILSNLQCVKFATLISWWMN